MESILVIARLESKVFLRKTLPRLCVRLRQAYHCEQRKLPTEELLLEIHRLDRPAPAIEQDVDALILRLLADSGGI